MIANIASNRPLSLAVLIMLAASFLVTGCKKPVPTTAESGSSAQTPVKCVPVTAPPMVTKHFYSAAALTQAKREHKRVILDFGGDWCGDCQVLDTYLHQSPNLNLLENNFLVAHIDIGHRDKNLDVAQRYNVPLGPGVPALAVLDASGKVLYSQQSGEFGDMRYMPPASVTEFLHRWKA